MNFDQYPKLCMRDAKFVREFIEESWREWCGRKNSSLTMGRRMVSYFEYFYEWNPEKYQFEKKPQQTNDQTNNNNRATTGRLGDNRDEQQRSDLLHAQGSDGSGEHPETVEHTDTK